MSARRDRDNDLTSFEAAALSGYPVKTILRWAREGTLPARKVTGRGQGGQYRIRQADLDAVLARPPSGQDPLAIRIRRVLAAHADELPEPTDTQIRLIAKLLPRPPRSRGEEADDVA